MHFRLLAPPLFLTCVACSAPDVAPLPEPSTPTQEQGQGSGQAPASIAPALAASSDGTSTPKSDQSDLPTATIDTQAANTTESQKASTPTEIPKPQTKVSTNPPPPGPPLISSPLEILPTHTQAFPQTPFTAWTIEESVPLLGQTQAPLGTIERIGVRVEGVFTQANWVQVRCTGCVGDLHKQIGWIPNNKLRAARTSGNGTDVLSVILRMRPRWAGGSDLPDNATNSDMCRLIDQGFVLDDRTATWGTGDGKIVLTLGNTAWTPTEVQAPENHGSWYCGTDGSHQPPTPPKGTP